jgi:hypothetical protein
MAKKTKTINVYLQTKYGYRRKSISKRCESIDEAVKFVDRAIGHHGTDDPRYWQKRPNYKNPFQSAAIMDGKGNHLLYIANNW